MASLVRDQLMRRRDFITLLGSAAAAWPLTGRAQQSPMPLIGFMSGRSPNDSAYLVAAFREGLGEAGFVEGQNIAIEYRWALGQYDRLPAIAAELVSRRVAVLAALGGELSALAAKQATATIPIVAGIGGDPIRIGLVESISHPGGNVTGYTDLSSSMEPKRLVCCAIACRASPSLVCSSIPLSHRRQVNYENWKRPRENRPATFYIASQQ
jgi:ABC-type uncharacterized transport system substrate-binding protein